MIAAAMLRSIRRLARRQADQIASPYLADLDRRLTEVNGRTDALQGAAVATLRQLDAVHGELRAMNARLEQEADNAREALLHIREEGAAQRRRLYALRTTDEYERAFDESEPLVSFVIPTYDRYESLREVALPSILAQTYANFEVVVAGDGSPPETEEAVTSFGDPRIRYCNRSVRGPYPDDKSVRWYVIGTPPYNDGAAQCRGRWIAALGDDDAVRPEHAEVLVEGAQASRCEHYYGRHQVHYPGGETLEVGTFPPAKGEFVLQASIYHAGLSFFHMEPADYLASEPNDWSLCRRMVAAGVRFGMVDRIVADKYESRYEKHADWGIHGVPGVE